MSTITIGKHRLENDIDVKVIFDGYEIFKKAVDKYDIKPDDFEYAEYSSFDSQGNINSLTTGTWKNPVTVPRMGVKPLKQIKPQNRNKHNET